jgi:hypothetical protein
MKLERKRKNMNILWRGTGFSRPRLCMQLLVFLLPMALLFATWPQNLVAYQDAPAPAQDAQGSQYPQQTPEQLQQLVAPRLHEGVPSGMRAYQRCQASEVRCSEAMADI